MPKYLGRLGGHLGFAMVKLEDGSLAETASAMVTVAHVAVCWSVDEPRSPHWFGPTEHPPTDAGERAAVDEWQHLHARDVLMAPSSTASDEIATIVQRLERLTIESPLAMVGELAHMQHRLETLITVAVQNARTLGTSWTVVAAALGTSPAEARRRFGSDD